MHALNCDKQSDKQLVRLTLKNADYFEYLVDRYEAKLNRYVRRISDINRENTEDLLQEVFLKIYKNLNDYDPKFSFSSWIYRITHNEAISFFRKQNARPKIAQSKNDEELDLLNLIPSNFNVKEAYQKKELARKVGQIIANLTEKYRTVLVLRFLEEKNYNEISDILQIPSGTVATLISRAKEQFKKLAEVHHLNKFDNP